jgi:hypothetical protein
MNLRAIALAGFLAGSTLTLATEGLISPAAPASIHPRWQDGGDVGQRHQVADDDEEAIGLAMAISSAILLGRLM